MIANQAHFLELLDNKKTIQHSHLLAYQIMEVETMGSAIARH